MLTIVKQISDLWYKLSSLVRITRKIILIKLSQIGLSRTLPFSLAISITYRCNSKCKTCGIWKLKHKNEMTTEQIEDLSKSLGTEVLWFTITGGEPFLRDDLAEIIKFLCKYNKPLVVNIATNGTIDNMSKVINDILKACDKRIKLVINFSIDELKNKYKEVRGIDAWDKVINNYNKVKLLKQKYKNLYLGVNITISQYNIQRFEKIYNYIEQNLQPDSIIAEPAMTRISLNNNKKDFMADKTLLIKVIKKLVKEERRNIKMRKSFIRFTRIMRLFYYKEVINILLNKEANKLACYAGKAYAEVTADNKITRCGALNEILVDLNKNKSNNLRSKFNLKRRYYSDCQCFMSNPIYISLLLNVKTLTKIIIYTLLSYLS